MKKISKKDLRELKRIQESIPQEWKDSLIIEKPLTPTMAKALSLALHSKDLTDEQRERFQTIKDSGIFNQKEEVENQKIRNKIDKYLSQEIEKSILAGRLSKRPNHG